MNKKTIATAFFVIAIGLIIWWAAEGAKMFTTTEKQIKTRDELFPDAETVTWEKDFTPGLEIIGPLFAVFMIGGAWMMYSGKKDQRLDRAK